MAQRLGKPEQATEEFRGQGSGMSYGAQSLGFPRIRRGDRLGKGMRQGWELNLTEK